MKTTESIVDLGRGLKVKRRITVYDNGQILAEDIEWVEADGKPVSLFIRPSDETMQTSKS